MRKDNNGIYYTDLFRFENGNMLENDNGQGCVFVNPGDIISIVSKDSDIKAAELCYNPPFSNSKFINLS